MLSINHLKDKPINKTLFYIFILMFAFMPLFPNILGAIQLHITIGSFLFSLVYLFFKREIQITVSKHPIFVYVFLFLLLFPAFYLDAVNGAISITNLTSLVRPLFLCTVNLMFIALLIDIKSMEETVYKVFTIIAIATFVFTLVELFIPALTSVVELFYKRQILKKSVAVTFYGQSYFSAFANFTVMVIVHARYLAKRDSFSLFVLTFAVAMLIMSQSKTMWFCLLSYYAAFAFISFNKIYKAMFSLLILVFVVIFIINIDLVVFYLQLFKLSSTNSLSVVLSNPQESATLGVRFAQIFFALDAIKDNYYLLGAGSGSSIYLESIYAAFIYRYGLIGLFTFLAISIALFVINMNSYKRLKGKDSLSWLGITLAIWCVLLPFSQFSSPMIEMSKPAILSSCMFALSLCLRHYSKGIRFYATTNIKV